ncbi:MAG TPA: hypothetical protein VGR24_11620 [bacterium]|nr:hypothetical protein [bacterium]
MFAVGAIIPVLPFIFFAGPPGIYSSLAVSGVGLFVIGPAARSLRPDQCPGPAFARYSLVWRLPPSPRNRKTDRCQSKRVTWHLIA